MRFVRKMGQTKSKLEDKKARGPLEFIHTDLAGPIDPEGREGFRYALSFVDDYSCTIFATPERHS